MNQERGLQLESNFAAVLFLAALLVVAFILLSQILQSSMEKIEWREETYIVQSGDTLWEIADEFCPIDVDKREWIYEVQTINNIHGSALYPGQRIRVLTPAD